MESLRETFTLIWTRQALFIVGVIGFITVTIIGVLGLENITPYEEIADFSLGLTFGMTVTGLIFTSRYAMKIRNLKLRLLKSRLQKNKFDIGS